MPASNWSDTDTLMALDWRDHMGVTNAEIAKALGKTRNAVIGHLYKVDQATKPSKHDGTMPRRWWQK